jgi:hypothetical protein
MTRLFRDRRMWDVYSTRLIKSFACYDAVSVIDWYRVQFAETMRKRPHPSRPLYKKQVLAQELIGFPQPPQNLVVAA